MNNSIEIHGERISLKNFSFSEEAVELYKKWYSDYDNKKNMGYVGEFSKTDIIRWKESQKSKNNQIMLNIVLNSSNRIIGMCSISLTNDYSGGEIEILIGETEARKKGLGTETLQLLVEYCFKTKNLNRLELKVLRGNIQAIKCYKSAGFMIDKDNNSNKIIEMYLDNNE